MSRDATAEGATAAACHMVIHRDSRREMSGSLACAGAGVDVSVFVLVFVLVLVFLECGRDWRCAMVAPAKFTCVDVSVTDTGSEPMHAFRPTLRPAAALFTVLAAAATGEDIRGEALSCLDCACLVAAMAAHPVDTIGEPRICREHADASTTGGPAVYEEESITAS